MILMVFALVIASFSSVMIFSSTTYQAIDSAFTSLNYSLPDLWIVTDVKEPLPSPMYDTYKVEIILSKYRIYISINNIALCEL